jgi:hypothetical protein
MSDLPLPIYVERESHSQDANKSRELALREREVAAREREVAAKEKEVKKSPYLVAAIVALVANLIVTGISSWFTRDIERTKSESALFQELIKTDRTTACANLNFAKQIKFVTDRENVIERICKGDPAQIPTLPQGMNLAPFDESSGEITGQVIDAQTQKPLDGVTVTPTDAAPTVVKTNFDGRFFLGEKGMNVKAHFEKEGYVSQEKQLSRYRNDETVHLAKKNP